MRLLPHRTRAEAEKQAQRTKAERELAIASDALASLVAELRAALSDAKKPEERTR